MSSSRLNPDATWAGPSSSWFSSGSAGARSWLDPRRAAPLDEEDGRVAGEWRADEPDEPDEPDEENGRGAE